MKPKYATIKAKDLKRDDYFIIIGKRKERWVSKVLDFGHPTEGRVVLVFTDNYWYINDVTIREKELSKVDLSNNYQTDKEVRDSHNWNIEEHKKKINLVKI